MFDNIPFGNGECCIILHQKPCTHFENCVLPLAKYKNTERKIIDEYCLSNPAYLIKDKARMCKCGKNSLEKGKQLCLSCKKKGRQNTWKKLKQKQRLDVLQK